MTQREEPAGERRSYGEILLEIAKHYEARGVGSGDFVAFGDAIRMTELEHRRSYLEQVRKPNINPDTYKEELALIRSGRQSLRYMREAHAEQYPGYGDLFVKAQHHVGQVVEASERMPSTVGSAFKNLRNIRDVVIAKLPIQ